MLQAVASLAELLFGDLIYRDEPTVETLPIFINKRGEALLPRRQMIASAPLVWSRKRLSGA